MSNEPQTREADLILNPFQYAYILDTTKGSINALVGPVKQSLSQTDRPVRFNDKERSFENVQLGSAIQQFPTAAEGSYMVLENPVSEGKDHPSAGASNQNPELDFGRKVNIPGPLMFPLWPSQVAEVIEGHSLRSNQYLVVRIYDEEAAKANWGKAVVKRATPKTDGEDGEDGEGGEDAPEPTASVLPETHVVPDLTVGQLLVIKGTEVSFYIPPTGVEVLPGEGKFVRNAVTLERLQYCVLLDESGTKRYVRGPAVVFPEATEAFLTESGDKIYASDTKAGKSSAKGARKFRAIELNENSGLYVKVIAPYTDEGGTEHSEGTELFITGKDQPIYFPREEHSIIKYGDEQIHFAVAIPDGEARYVLNRLTGKITLVKGPLMFLADPRTEVIIRRMLSENLVRLLYPGNEEAVEHNRELEELTSGEVGEDFVYERTARRRDRSKRLVSAARGVNYAASQTSGLMPQSFSEEAGEGQVQDDFERRQSYTPPRTITLETKYDGAVAVNVWTGYAILTVNKRGGRQVHIGPCNVLLDYDETVEVLELSTGMPKATDNLKRTAYLRVLNNTVSDRVEAETQDLVEVNVAVSYRVDFEGEEHEKWFGVENYVKFLTEHLRSMIRGAVKKVGVEQFNDHATEIVRDTILGQAGEGGKRAGRAFSENAMRVYDVEVLNVEIGDDRISSMLVQTQHASVKSALTIRQRERDLEITKRSELIVQQEEEARQATAIRINELTTESIASKLAKDLAEIDSRHKAIAEGLDRKKSEQEVEGQIQEAELERQKKREDQRQAFEEAAQALRLAHGKAETDNLVARAEAIGPNFLSALNSLGDKDFAARVAKEMAPLAVLRGGSVADALTDLVSNLPAAAETIQGLFKSNGSRIPADAPAAGSDD